jgi:hypothetical protein
VNREQFLAFHKRACDQMFAICRAKNADYAGVNGGGDAFANFRTVEAMGIASTEQGMLTRMSDKMARLASFVQQGSLQVKDESAQDTLLDLANYCILMAGYLCDKQDRIVAGDDKVMRHAGT